MNRGPWLVGQFAGLLGGALVWIEHGPAAGFAVGYGLLLLVDIRAKEK